MSAAEKWARPALSGWYLVTPAGFSGPYAYSSDARAACPPGQSWPVQFIASTEDADGGEK